ncbi:hypothetical protein FPOAC2_08573 [Fusarium poae]|uniref:Amidoligase enzyme n=1 Tax=Fusarium poae TaxID=36050 RepID=A0A1B8ALL2_FUSPO|nr:hypothetical protein FPOAC1_008640 [Fusarium poae]KAG8669251.1 hypothetical protein FPOAC1_008640 [Fusarium poae]OBS21479.1 hypothetical protein FPOA_07817 [Fusarium poae]
MSSLTWDGLTFGVELEFMAAPPERAHWKLYTPAAAARSNVSKLLSQHTTLPIACECEHFDNEACAVCADIPDKYKVDRVCYIQPGASAESMVADACFLFKYEFLECVKAINAERCWPGVEVCTPILGQAELASGLPTIKTFLSALRKTGAFITADESCGMHVHVGVEEGMTVYLAKRITTLVVLLENTLILRLVAPCRWTSTYARPICDDSQAAEEDTLTIEWADMQDFEKHMPSQSSMRPSKWNNNDPKMYYRMLRTIWSCRDLDNLSMQLRRRGISRCGLAIALRNAEVSRNKLYPRSKYEGTPTTVEFRYSQMTFDHVLLRNWVEVVARIVDLARAQDEEFKKIVQTIIDLNYEAGVQHTSAWKSLLERVFKLEHRIPEWEAQLDKFKQGEYISLLNKRLLLLPE